MTYLLTIMILREDNNVIVTLSGLDNVVNSCGKMLREQVFSEDSKNKFITNRNFSQKELIQLLHKLRAVANPEIEEYFSNDNGKNTTIVDRTMASKKGLTNNAVIEYH